MGDKYPNVERLAGVVGAGEKDPITKLPRSLVQSLYCA